MERTTTAQTAPELVRLVIAMRRQLDGEAIAALFLASCSFRIIAVSQHIEAAVVVCRHRRPDVLIIDGSLLFGEGSPDVPLLLEQINYWPMMVLDDEINEALLSVILKYPRIGYFTRATDFRGIAAGIRQLMRGEIAYCPSVRKRIQLAQDGNLLPEQSESWISRLTPREIEVMKLISAGRTIRECADHLQISPSTIDNHKSRLMKKLDIHRSIDLMRFALHEGLIQLDSVEGMSVPNSVDA
jgi:DNA-binding NarL/FixJ family response regulator